MQTVELDAHELRTMASALRRHMGYLRAQLERDRRTGFEPGEGKPNKNVLRMNTAQGLLAKVENALGPLENTNV